MNGKQKVHLELRKAYKFSPLTALRTQFKFLQCEGIFNFYVSRLEANPSFKNNIAEGSYLGEILIVKLMKMLYILLLPRALKYRNVTRSRFPEPMFSSLFKSI